MCVCVSIYIYIYIYIYAIMKAMCPPGYHNNGFVATHALGHMMYSYTLLVPMNQRALNKLSKEHNISGYKWSTTHRALKSHRTKMSIRYICNHENNVPPRYHHNGFVATHALGYMMYRYTLSVPMNQRMLNKWSLMITYIYRVRLNRSSFVIHYKGLNFHNGILCYHEPFHDKMKTQKSLELSMGFVIFK